MPHHRRPGRRPVQLLDEHGFESPEVDLTGGLATAWGTHTEHVVATLACDEVVEHTDDGMHGPATIGATIDAFQGFDLLVYRWDLAQSWWSGHHDAVIECPFPPSARMPRSRL